jgi:hypothetical protein
MSGTADSAKTLYRVAVCARAGGRYTYQLFTVAAEPRTFLTADTSFDSPQEAERAGYEALELLDHWVIAEMGASMEPPAE